MNSISLAIAGLILTGSALSYEASSPTPPSQSLQIAPSSHTKMLPNNSLQPVASPNLLRSNEIRRWVF